MARLASCRVAAGRGELAKACMTLVETFDAEAGERLFYADSRESGALCSAWVPLGTRVVIHAQALGESCGFLVWGSGFGASAGAMCPCEQSSEPTCRFTVEHDTYCGAAFSASEAPAPDSVD